MKIVSVDIETTGLKPLVHSIVQFAAVVGDTNGRELGRYHAWLMPDGMVWDIYCLNLHKDWLRDVLQRVKDNQMSWQSFKQPTIHSSFNAMVGDFQAWLDIKQVWRPGDPKLNALGKNFGSFDYQFLQANGLGHLFAQRSLDPAPYYTLKTDERTPDLKVCKARAAGRGCIFDSSEVAHTALEDALDVMALYQFYHENPWLCGVP